MGLFLWGYAKLYAVDKNPRHLEQIDAILDLLEGLKSRICSGNGWGYNFDWQSRAFFAPKGTPTVVNSSSIGHALLDTWQMTGNRRALDLALPIGNFILRDLNRYEEDGTVCFSYTPLDHYHVHNANLLGASLLIRFYEICKSMGNGNDDVAQSIVRSSDSRIGKDFLDPRLRGNDKRGGNDRGENAEERMIGKTDSSQRTSQGQVLHENGKTGIMNKDEIKETAIAALAYSMKHQRADGSWFYAEKESAHWIDSFHTGFNLEAIKVFLDLGYGEEYRPGFERGVDFYARQFFLEDGTPKYYHDRIYPIDIHAPAQAVVFFSRMGPAYAELTRRILEWMIANMQDPAGFFYFQKHQWYTNRIPYMRWGQAWAFHALTECLFHHDG